MGAGLGKLFFGIFYFLHKEFGFSGTFIFFGIIAIVLTPLWIAAGTANDEDSHNEDES